MPAKKTTTDRPNVHFSFGQFDDAAIEPFIYMTQANKRVTFPDIYGMEAERGDKLIAQAQRGTISTAELLSEWLGEDDYKVFKADRLSLRKTRQLLEMAMNHYEKYSGDEGEDAASGS